MTQGNAGDIPDWAEVWKDRVIANQRLKDGIECAGLWQSRQAAAKYDAGVRKSGRAKARALLQRIGLSSGQRVLDIGAGPGTHTIPIATMVSRVTAIEPAPGMADVLEENLLREGLENVKCVRKKWEDVAQDDLEAPYDVVLASLSLGMPDIRPTLEKMDRVCSGKVCLVWAAGVTAWERYYTEAWPLLHGTPYASGPKADVLFNVLYQMGICPDVVVFRENYDETFHSLDEAVEYYKPMYCVSTPEKEAALIRYLGKKLDRGPGGISMRGVSTMAVISWDVMTNRLSR